MPKLSDEFQKAKDAIIHLTDNTKPEKWTMWADSMGYTDKELLNFLSDVDNNKHKISDIDSYMQSASTSTAQFTATLKNIAVNALPILAISAAIQLVQAGWDALNVTVEEQEAKVNSLQTAYQNLQSEYEQLSGKQDPTDAEKDRLSYLERRLELDERILKAEKSQLFDEKTGNKFTDLFDPENMETQYKKEMAGSGGEWNFLSGFAQNRDGYAYLSGLYERKMEDIQASQQQIEEWTKYRDSVEEGSDAWNIYQSNIDSAQNRQTDAIDTLSEKEDQLVINLGKYADNMEYLEEQLASDNLTDSQTKTAQEQLAMTVLHPAGIQKHVKKISLSVLRRSADWQAHENIGNKKTNQLQIQKRRNYLWTILRWNQGTIPKFRPKAQMIFQKL